MKETKRGQASNNSLKRKLKKGRQRALSIQIRGCVDVAHCQQKRIPNRTASCQRRMLVALCCPLHVTGGTELNTVVFVRLTLVAADDVGNVGRLSLGPQPAAAKVTGCFCCPGTRHQTEGTNRGGGGDVKQCA